MKSDEVLELVADEYPKKYEEYMNVVQEREFQAALRRKMMEARRASVMVPNLCVEIDMCKRVHLICMYMPRKNINNVSAYPID